jgi:arabinogalactan endo-1,4-beta-galactosidase
MVNIDEISVDKISDLEKEKLFTRTFKNTKTEEFSTNMTQIIAKYNEKVLGLKITYPLSYTNCRNYAYSYNKSGVSEYKVMVKELVDMPEKCLLLFVKNE